MIHTLTREPKKSEIGTNGAFKSMQLAGLPSEADEGDDEDALGLVMIEGFEDDNDEGPSEIQVTSGKGWIVFQLLGYVS